MRVGIVFAVLLLVSGCPAEERADDRRAEICDRCIAYHTEGKCHELHAECDGNATCLDDLDQDSEAACPDGLAGIGGAGGAVFAGSGGTGGTAPLDGCAQRCPDPVDAQACRDIDHECKANIHCYTTLLEMMCGPIDPKAFCVPIGGFGLGPSLTEFCQKLAECQPISVSNCLASYGAAWDQAASDACSSRSGGDPCGYSDCVLGCQ